MVRLLIVASMLLAINGLLSAGSQSTQSTSFEVVSIKPIEALPPYPNFFIEGTKFRGNHVTAAMIVARAYQIHRSQLFNGPSWIDSERFNLEARAEVVLPPKTESGDFQEPLLGMVRGILNDRFQLRVRREMREMPVLALTYARSDRKTTDRLRPAKVVCADTQSAVARATTAEAKAAVFADCFERQDIGTLSVRGGPIARLASGLGGRLGHLVIDDTGLRGSFDIDLKWPLSVNQAERDAMMLTALQEQLGLKLQTRKIPMPAVIIENIERPSAN